VQKNYNYKIISNRGTQNVNEKTPANTIEEDEIDLKELFKTLMANKKTIAIITTLVTLLAVAYVVLKTPIYEVAAIVEIGSYKDQNNDDKLLDDANKLAQELNVLYIDIYENEKDREFWIENINALKKQKNFIKLSARAFNNQDAVGEVQRVVDFIQEKHKKYIDDVVNEKNLELSALQNKIDSLNNNTLVGINEDIKYTREIAIPSLEKKIAVSKQKLSDMQKQLKITEQNIAKTQSQNASLTALNVIEKRSLEAQISSLELSLIDLQDKLVTEKEKTLPRLERKKSELVTMELHQLLEKKKILETALLPHNYKNSAIVGKIITNDKPVKPKKELIVVVAFVTGFILAIFFVFFREFIRGVKQDD
jgi:uncharacterized protein involved in exopolysaccharide biosynthesis